MVIETIDTTEPQDVVNPLDTADLRSRVQTVLDSFLVDQAAALGTVSPECVALVDSIATLLRGGKRLRPAFCYWGFRGAGGADSTAVVAACAALELFQAAALIHDDLMDDSDTRRGEPALHRRFAGLHRSSGWTADPERFGVAGALLAGDLCLVWSDELLTHSGLDAVSLARGRAVFDRMRTELMAGQYLDMLEQALPSGAGTVERARRVIKYKSAKYTIEHPLLLGGRLAGGTEPLLATYSAYGLPLGEAFQLRDDLLGVYGDPAVTGKPAGDDLREGKRTVLVAKALDRATPAQQSLITTLLGDACLDHAGVDALREVFVTTGAVAAVEQLIEELAVDALSALDTAAVAEPARGVLTDLVQAATSRAG